jgi:hypothetical protein
MYVTSKPLEIVGTWITISSRDASAALISNTDHSATAFNEKRVASFKSCRVSVDRAIESSFHVGRTPPGKWEVNAEPAPLGAFDVTNELVVLTLAKAGESVMSWVPMKLAMNVFAKLPCFLRQFRELLATLRVPAAECGCRGTRKNHLRR